ncbi:hypothetical protein [Microbacterium sp.]|uniref:hypothetical protein n=1 Tax=Microbacterium sp. TaxID=51671 RepID=UPI003F9A8453
MATYEELPGIIGPLKRAAIDAYMADQSFTPDIGSPESYYSFWGWLPNSYDRPNTNGEGGGAVTGIGSSMAPSFDNIRARVDGAVSRWLEPSLPDGSKASGPLTAVRSAAATLGASGTGGALEANGVIERSSESVNTTILTNISGSFTTPFLNKYYSQFLNVAHGIGVACAMLEINYSVQSKAWPAARTDVATICDNARQALSTFAEDTADALLKYGLTVVATAAGAVASIATAGAAAPLVAAMVTIAGTATMAIQALDSAATINGSSYDEIMESFESALEKVSTTISEQEDALVTMMNEAVSKMHANAANFDLDKVQFGDFTGTAEMIDIKQYRADLVSDNMLNVSDSLGLAKTALGSAPATNPTPRDGTIGAGASGTHTAATSLYDLAVGCLASTAQEYSLGRDLFNATIDDYFQNDQTSKTKIEQVWNSEKISDVMGGS